MENGKEVPTIPKEDKKDAAYTALKPAWNANNTVVTILFGMIAASASMVAIYFQLDSKIDKKVEEKFKDPVFINKLAEDIRFPFVIFDEDNSVIVDAGAMNIIEKITIDKKGGSIIVTPKKYLAIAPILESLNPAIIFLDPIRGNKFDFIYKKYVQEAGNVWADTYPNTTKPPKSKFRIQVIILPKGN